MDDFDAGIEELLDLTEPAGRRENSAASEFKASLGPGQVALVDDTAPMVSAHPGRRGGKTTAVVCKVALLFERVRDGRAFYFAPTGEQGVDIMWENAIKANREFGLGWEERWSEKVWTRGEARLEVFSFHDRSDVERARGRWAHFVDVDEAQLAPTWFANQFEAAILPVTVDYLGQVWATGTPAPVAEGFFFDACHDTERWSTGHHWTANDNPFFIRQGRDVLAEVRARFHFLESNPTYQREWLGLWVVDPDALVYYIPDAAVQSYVGAYHGNVLGLDLGWKDHDAIAVIGITHDRQRSHLRHMETKGQQTNHQLFARLLELAGRFPGPLGGNARPSPIVVYDPAGHATTKTIETFRSDAPEIIWVQAEKTRKVEFIEWLNNDLREGSTTVEPGVSMIKEAKRLRWKKPGKLAEDADHSDQGDAWLYSWRYARDLLRRMPVEIPLTVMDSPWKQWAARQAEVEGENPWAKAVRGRR